MSLKFSMVRICAIQDRCRIGNSNIYNTNPVGTPSPTNTGYLLSAAEKAALDAGVSTNWQKLIYRKAPIMNHNFSISGGTDKSKYSLSAGYFKQGGVIPNQDYTRYSIRSTMDHQLNKRIKVGLNRSTPSLYKIRPVAVACPAG